MRTDTTNLSVIACNSGLADSSCFGTSLVEMIASIFEVVWPSTNDRIHCNACDEILGINVLADASKSFFLAQDGLSTGIPSRINNAHLA